MMDESDSQVTCPYNKSHVVYKSRLQTHLTKCSYANLHPQKNVDPLNLRVCRYNANHHIPAAELEHHHTVCPDMGVLTRFLMPVGGKGSAIPYTPIELPPTEENWDDDGGNSYTYDPTEHTTNGVILRAAQGVPRAERKNFRLRERERINRIRENEEALEKTQKPTPKPQPVVVVEKHAFTEQALRHPKLGQLGQLGMGRGRGVAASSALTGDDDIAVQGIGRAYNLRGMSNGLQNLPPMRPKATNVNSIAATAGSSSASAYSSSDSMPSTSNSSGDSMPSTSKSFVDEDGFVEQRSKKNSNKKKAENGAALGKDPSNNPLTTPDSEDKFSFPGLPGKGRGRIRKN